MPTAHFDELRRAAMASDHAACPFVGFMGEVGLVSELQIPAGTHSLHYGSSLFEGIRAFRQPNGQLAVWLLEEHLDRLFHSFEVAQMKSPMSRDNIRQLILDIVAFNDDGASPSIYVRPLGWRGEGLGVDASAVETHFMVLTRPWGQYLALSHNGGAKVLASNRSRPTANMVDGTAKLAGFYGLWSVPEKLLARKCGCDEAIFAPNPALCLQDGTGQEIMVWGRDGVRRVLSFHPGSDGVNILHSTTRAFLTEGLTSTDIERFPYQEVASISLLGDVVGMALVGTATGVMPVTRIAYGYGEDGWQEVDIGNGFPHPPVVELANFYNQVVTGQHSAYEHLLTPVPPVDEVFLRHTQNGTMTDGAFLLWKRNDAKRRQQTLSLA